MKNQWDPKDEELLRQCTDEVIARIAEIGDASPGIIAARDIIDIVLERLAPEIYNKALNDAKKIITARMSDLEIDLETLEQRD